MIVLQIKLLSNKKVLDDDSVGDFRIHPFSKC